MEMPVNVGKIIGLDDATLPLTGIKIRQKLSGRLVSYQSINNNVTYVDSFWSKLPRHALSQGP